MRGVRILAAVVPVALLAAGTTGAAAAGGPARPGHEHVLGDRGRPATPSSYYLALGDSLAQGVQPLGSGGADIVTDRGYADDLYAVLRPFIPGLRLEKLGCPGETAGTMIAGGICGYAPYASQLQAAVAFLRAHRGHVPLVTIDIGANDVDGCASSTGLSPTCAAAGLTAVGSGLPRIVSALRSADPGGQILGMTYYDPFLAAWLLGPAGEEIARASVPLAEDLNGLLERDYAAGRIGVAPVQEAFRTSDFSALPTGVPRNVALICAWTWMCASPPAGPDIHANAAGYAVIAGAFLSRVRGVARYGRP